MSQLIDDLARELASPTSRRGVMRLLGGAMVGILYGAFRPASLQAQTCVPACTGKKGTCCPGLTTPFCVTTGKLCCGNTKCGAGKICCTTAASPFCAYTGTTCCGKNACKTGEGETCCNNSTCCHAKYVCIKGRCQASKGLN